MSDSTGASMQAVVLAGHGDSSVLKFQDAVPVPEPGPSEVLVRVHATAVNRADVLQRQGRYAIPPGAPPDILGLEYAGIVARIGSKVREFSGGERVFGLAVGGTYAQYVAVHERTVVRMPAGMAFETAAAVPESYTTAHDAMFTLGGFSIGETVLVQAVGSNLGIAAVQLARAAGGFSIGTSRTPSKLEAARTAGCDLALMDDGNVAAEVRAFTSGRGADVVLNVIGPSKFASDIDALKTRGRIVLLGGLGGESAAVDFRALMGKRGTLIGTTMRARPLEESIAAARAFAHGVVPLLGSKLFPVVDRVYALEDAAKAHAALEANENFGKIVLRVA